MYYGSFLYLVFYFFNRVFRKNLTQPLTAEQSDLKKLVNLNFSQEEARYLWSRINDHKWYVGERLGRDVGLKVAAFDYLENIYQFKTAFKKNGGFHKSYLQIFENLSSMA